jgi:sugar lactone lactonase YvrE
MKIRALTFASVALAVMTSAASSQAVDPYEMSYVFPPAAMRSPAGVTMDPEGSLFAASALGNHIYKINPDTGAVVSVLQPPLGNADDLAFSPSGLMAWTALNDAMVRTRDTAGTIKDVAAGLRFINSIGFSADGRLFAAQVTPTLGTLYEIDPAGLKPAQPFIEGLAGLNAFQITADNVLYGPLAREGAVVRIDLKTKDVARIATGFKEPVAVKVGPDKHLYVAEWETGAIIQLNLATMERRVVAQLTPPIDNLTIAANGDLFVAQPCEDGIVRVDVKTGRTASVVRTGLGLPGGLRAGTVNGADRLLLTNLVCEMDIDPGSENVRRVSPHGSMNWFTMVDWTGGNTAVFSSFVSGAVSWIDVASGTIKSSVRGLKSPYGVALRNDGKVVVAETSANRLAVVAADQAQPEVLVEGLRGPVGVIIDTAGRGYVSEPALGRVSEFNPITGDIRVLAEGLGFPEGLALLDDQVLAVDSKNKRVVSIAVSDGTTSVLATNLPIGMPSPFGTDSPYVPNDIAVDSTGQIFLSSDIEQTILKLTKRN